VDLYGTALVLEEFGKVMAHGGSGVVISSHLPGSSRVCRRVVLDLVKRRQLI